MLSRLRPHHRLGLLLGLVFAYPWSCAVFDLSCDAIDVYTAREARAVLARLRPRASLAEVTRVIGYPSDAWAYRGYPTSPDTYHVWPVGGRRVRVYFWQGQATEWTIHRAHPGPIRAKLDAFFHGLEYHFWDD